MPEGGGGLGAAGRTIRRGRGSAGLSSDSRGEQKLVVWNFSECVFLNWVMVDFCP